MLGDRFVYIFRFENSEHNILHASLPQYYRTPHAAFPLAYSLYTVLKLLGLLICIDYRIFFQPYSNRDHGRYSAAGLWPAHEAKRDAATPQTSKLGGHR